jgi:hypothetical protein
MQRISQIFAALLLTGCHADPPVAKNSPAAPQPATRHSVVDSTRLQTLQDSLAVLAGAPDTFRASNGQVFRMREISKARYDAASGPGLERTFPADSAAAVATERAFIRTAAGRVWRAADTLFFRTDNGSISWLHDGPTYPDADDSYEGYRYLASLPEIQQWLVEVGQWEGRHYLLIDQQTGKKSKLISYPVISLDRKRFACANADPTGYSLEGIQLWQKPAGQPPQLRWQRLRNALQDGITAVAPRWEGNTTLFFYEDFTIAGKYVQVRL